MNGRGVGHREGSPVNGHMHGHMGHMDNHQGGSMYRPLGGGLIGRGRRGICRDYHSKPEFGRNLPRTESQAS